MKLNQITIIQRIILSNLLSLVIVSLGIFMVIRSLDYVESILKTQASEHVSVLTINSDISRRVFKLTSRVKLLEQTFLFSENTLSEEAFYIDLELQNLRELSTNQDFSNKMDIFIDDFHRFLGSSVALNRILKKSEIIDGSLAKQLDELALYVAEKKLKHIEKRIGKKNEKNESGDGGGGGIDSKKKKKKEEEKEEISSIKTSAGESVKENEKKSEVLAAVSTGESKKEDE